jgi:outer membrane protein OmpA-like peptidoglycan-associated protein
MLALSLLTAIAFGQEAIKLEVVHSVHAPKRPALIVLPQIDATSLQIDLQCSTAEAHFMGPAKRGAKIRLEIPVSVGVHTCTGQLDGQFADGTTGSMPLNFQVAVANPIAMQVSMADLDLEAHTLRVHLNQAVARIDLAIFGETGAQIGVSRIDAVNQSPAKLKWTADTDTVLRIQITATGTSGMSTTLDLFPWRFRVPHEELIFPSGSSEIPRSERHKLESTYLKIAGTIAKISSQNLGFEMPISLYVAGYTDTVGNKVNNRRLSERRAAALARWFRLKGFPYPIHYQGFGESALAVPTADETPEAANRRALYIIAADTPPVSSDLPLSHWQLAR